MKMMHAIVGCPSGRKQYRPTAAVPGRKGFSLIEIIVVIGVIVILLAVLIPTLAGVRRYSDRVECSTNMRGVAQMILLYTNDHDSHLPHTGIAGMPSMDSEQRVLDAPGRWWREALLPYGFRPYYGGDPKRSVACPVGPVGHGIHIGVNANTNPDRFLRGEQVLTRQQSIYNIENPARVIMLAEVNGGSDHFRHIPGRWDFRHNGDMNVVFFDGHAELRRGELDPDEL